MSNQKVYLSHLDGLKGLSCVMVMIGHYIGVYKFAEYFPGDFAGFDLFLNSKLSFILDEQFYVKLFFIISGYLVSKSVIDSTSKLMKKCVQRFLRLGLPILFAYGIIWLIYHTIGFHTIETEAVVLNQWFQTMYNGAFQFVDVITSPVDVLILNRFEWNAPYWVLNEMFVASLSIYALNYLRNHMKKDSILLIIIAGFIVGYLGVYDVAIACLLGMSLCWFEKEHKKIYVVILLGVGLYVAYKGYFSWLFFCVLIVILPKVAWLKKLFSSKVMLLLGKISFGIYSFHWPVFCSLGMIIFLKVSGAYGVATALMISGVCTTLVTVGISIVYHYVFEKRIYKIISHI